MKKEVLGEAKISGLGAWTAGQLIKISPVVGTVVGSVIIRSVAAVITAAIGFGILKFVIRSIFMF